jgi:hypothetical protein
MMPIPASRCFRVAVINSANWILSILQYVGLYASWQRVFAVGAAPPL